MFINSVSQLRDDLMTMLIAGHETTAAVLTWSIFLLAQVRFLSQISKVSGVICGGHFQMLMSFLVCHRIQQK